MNRKTFLPVGMSAIFTAGLAFSQMEAEMPAGYHTFTIDITGLASGIYFYQLKTGDFTATRKMVLAK